MKRGRWIRYALTMAVALLVWLLSDLLGTALREATEGTSYAWLLTVVSIAGFTVSAIFTILFFVRQSSRRAKEPPQIWRVASRAWNDALVERETLPYETKELQR